MKRWVAKGCIFMGGRDLLPAGLPLHNNCTATGLKSVCTKTNGWPRKLCCHSHVHAWREDDWFYNYSPGNDLAAANTIHKSANVDNKLINVLK